MDYDDDNYSTDSSEARERGEVAKAHEINLSCEFFFQMPRKRLWKLLKKKKRCRFRNILKIR